MKTDTLVSNFGKETAIKLLEERISYAKTHPRNSFFVVVIQDAQTRLKTIKSIKNETETI